MGDKSPKSKERKNNQKKAARQQDTAKAKAKQEGQNRRLPLKSGG